MKTSKSSKSTGHRKGTPQVGDFKADEWLCAAIVDTIGDPTEPNPQMALELDIKVPYPGSCLSVNHYKYFSSKLRRTRTDTRQWMTFLVRLVAPKVLVHSAGFESATITLEGFFKDKRAPDLANLHKVIGDALQEALHLNDKHFNFVDTGKHFGCTNPFLTMIVTIKLRKSLIKKGGVNGK